MQRGWEVCCLLSVRPLDPNSMLFHVPNVHVTALQSEALGIPRIEEASGAGEAAELDALRRIFRRADVDGIVVGAVASEYQHRRVNRIGHELGLPVFAPLWRLDPVHLVHEYLRAGMRIVFSSVSAAGLDASWLGRAWDAATVAKLLELRQTHGVHPCGEGGEFETLVLDAPFFRERIVVDRVDPSWSHDSGVWRVVKAHLEEKARR